MYKFTNGVVVYDEATRDRYIKAGMTLVEEPKPVVKEEKENGESKVRSDFERNEFRPTKKGTGKFSKRIR